MAGVITEIAIECGVSEQAVRAWCRRNHVAKDAKGSFAISESQKTAIYQHYLGVERKASFATGESKLRNLRNHFDRYAAGRIRPEKRATCCKGQADRGTERKVGGGQLGVGDGTADCGSGPGSPCWDNASAASFRQVRSRSAGA